MHNRQTILLIDNQGLSFYTSYLALGLSSYHDITLYGLSEEDYVLTGAADEGKIRFHNIGARLPKKTSILSIIVVRPVRWFSILFNALIIKEKFDTVHIQGHLPLFFLFIPIIKLRSRRICWTLHDVRLRPSSRGMRGKMELLYMRTITQTSILKKYADSIIVHGTVLKNQLVSEGVDTKKIHTMPIFDYRYLLKSENISMNHKKNASLTLPEGYVLVFGRIKPYKGIDVLIRAAKIVRQKTDKNKKFNMLIAGKGDVSYFKDLLSGEDGEYIHVRNEFIPNSEISELFRKAKFVVLPYTDASQSAVTSLAYTFSKPVVASNAGSIAEYVVHGETGFVFESGDSVELANYIMELIGNEDKCLEMGGKAHQKMLNDMSLEKCCGMINGIYNKRN